MNTIQETHIIPISLYVSRQWSTVLLEKLDLIF